MKENKWNGFEKTYKNNFFDFKTVFYFPSLFIYLFLFYFPQTF